MRSTPHRLLLIAGASALLLGTGGCTRVRSHNGFLIDPLIANSVQPGIDNRDSVRGALGQPTFASQFGPELWYYVSRDMKQFAYRTPKPVDQTVLRVAFDPAGKVASVDRIGMEQVAKIDPAGDKTQTLGRDRSLFEEIFGNIGAVGAAGAGGGAVGGGSGGPGS